MPSVAGADAAAPTIFAVSSGRPPAAIAVIRISGPAAFAAAGALAGQLPTPRRAALRALRDDGGALLDRALVLVFEGPRTATGEDLVELHCHGGRAVVDAVERALAAQPGCRRAEPGEFTRRALTNGRLDLAEAEGLADLLAAETEGQRRAALDRAEGRLSRLVRGWMDRVSALAATVEAAIDYGDEVEVTIDRDAMAVLARELERFAAMPPVDRWRDGVRVVLAGPPNSGKSTLLNLLAGREAAIVSPVAGTTRDRVEVSVTREGVPFVLIDTAGLRDQVADPVEAIGVARARAAGAAADVLLWLGDDGAPLGSWAVHTRADLPGREAMPAGAMLAVSEREPASVERLWTKLGAGARELLPSGDVAADRSALERCARAAQQLALASREDDVLLCAEQLRVAHRELGSILGVNATEAMLDALFGRFCLGK